MPQAIRILSHLTSHPGYSYLPISAGWAQLTAPFASRIVGTKQVTDAYLLGLALATGNILVTLDRGLLHLAGEHAAHIKLLEPIKPS